MIHFVSSCGLLKWSVCVHLYAPGGGRCSLSKLLCLTCLSYTLRNNSMCIGCDVPYFTTIFVILPIPSPLCESMYYSNIQEKWTVCSV